MRATLALEWKTETFSRGMKVEGDQRFISLADEEEAGRLVVTSGSPSSFC